MTLTQSVDITDILRVAATENASDVILTAGLPPQFKISGVFGAQGFGPLGLPRYAS